MKNLRRLGMLTKFRFESRQTACCLALCLFCLQSTDSVLLDAVSFQLAAPPPLTGGLTSNNLLLDAEHLHRGQVGTPHSYVTLADNVYAVTDGGHVINVAPCRPMIVASLRKQGCATTRECGHLVSVRLDANNLLLVLDAYRGLFEVHPWSGVVRQLYDSSTLVNGRSSLHLNDFVVLQDGSVVMSDVSPTFDYDHEFWARFEGRPDGRLIRLNLTSGQPEELVAGLAYPAGLEVTEDGKFLLVSEAGRAQVLRVDLASGQNMQRSFFAQNLPGMPEHIRRSGRGTYWVGVTYPRYQGEVSVMDQYSGQPASRNFLAMRRTQDQLQLMYNKRGLAVELSGDGRVLHSLHDPTGLRVSEVLEIAEYSALLYVGTRGVKATVRIVGSTSSLTVDSYVQVLRGRCQVTEDKVQEAKNSIQQRLNPVAPNAAPGYDSPGDVSPASGINRSDLGRAISPSLKQRINISEGLSKLHKTLVQSSNQAHKSQPTDPNYSYSYPNNHLPTAHGQLPLDKDANLALNFQDPFLPPPDQLAHAAPPRQNGVPVPAHANPHRVVVGGPGQPHVVHTLHQGQLVSHVVLGNRAESALAGKAPALIESDQPNFSSPTERNIVSDSNASIAALPRSLPAPNAVSDKNYAASNIVQPTSQTQPQSVAAKSEASLDLRALGGFLGLVDDSAIQSGSSQHTTADPSSAMSMPDRHPPGHLEPLHGVLTGAALFSDQPAHGFPSFPELQSMGQAVGAAHPHSDHTSIGSVSASTTLRAPVISATRELTQKLQTIAGAVDITRIQTTPANEHLMRDYNSRPLTSVPVTNFTEDYKDLSTSTPTGLRQDMGARIYSSRISFVENIQLHNNSTAGPAESNANNNFQDQFSKPTIRLDSISPKWTTEAVKEDRNQHYDTNLTSDQSTSGSFLRKDFINVQNDLSKRPLAPFSGAATIHQNQPTNAVLDKKFPDSAPAFNNDRIQSELAEPSVPNAQPGTAGYIQVYKGPGQYLLIPLTHSSLLQALTGLIPPKETEKALSAGTSPERNQSYTEGTRPAEMPQSKQVTMLSSVLRSQGDTGINQEPIQLSNLHSQQNLFQANGTIHSHTEQQPSSETALILPHVNVTLQPKTNPRDSLRKFLDSPQTTETTTGKYNLQQSPERDPDLKKAIEQDQVQRSNKQIQSDLPHTTNTTTFKTDQQTSSEKYRDLPKANDIPTHRADQNSDLQNVVILPQVNETTTVKVDQRSSSLGLPQLETVSLRRHEQHQSSQDKELDLPQTSKATPRKNDPHSPSEEEIPNRRNQHKLISETRLPEPTTASSLAQLMSPTTESPSVNSLEWNRNIKMVPTQVHNYQPILKATTTQSNGIVTSSSRIVLSDGTSTAEDAVTASTFELAQEAQRYVAGVTASYNHGVITWASPVSETNFTDFLTSDSQKSLSNDTPTTQNADFITASTMHHAQKAQISDISDATVKRYSIDTSTAAFTVSSSDNVLSISQVLSSDQSSTTENVDTSWSQRQSERTHQLDVEETALDTPRTLRPTATWSQTTPDNFTEYELKSSINQTFPPEEVITLPPNISTEDQQTGFQISHQSTPPGLFTQTINRNEDFHPLDDVQQRVRGDDFITPTTMHIELDSDRQTTNLTLEYHSLTNTPIQNTPNDLEGEKTAGYRLDREENPRTAQTESYDQSTQPFTQITERDSLDERTQRSYAQEDIITSKSPTQAGLTEKSFVPENITYIKHTNSSLLYLNTYQSSTSENTPNNQQQNTGQPTHNTNQLITSSSNVFSRTLQTESSSKTTTLVSIISPATYELTTSISPTQLQETNRTSGEQLLYPTTTRVLAK